MTLAIRIHLPEIHCTMINLSKCALARKRPDSVWVHGAEYFIRTEFFYWINYQRIRTDPKTPLVGFDQFYKGAVPEDRVAGIKALDGFLVNEQPMPHPEYTEKSDIQSFDWLADSEYINAKFLEVYGIDLETEDMHWHRFLGLFHAILTDLNSIISARQHKSEDERADEDTYDKGMERMRNAWWIAGTKPAKRGKKKKRSGG